MTVRAWFKLCGEQTPDSVVFDDLEIVNDVKKKIKNQGGAKPRDVELWEMALHDFDSSKTRLCLLALAPMKSLSC